MINRSRFLAGVALVAALVLLAAGSSFAQTSNGTIAGVVSDKTGGVVPNATVAALSVDLGGEKRTATTDAVGSYRIEALIPGAYEVVISAAGFGDLKISRVQVKASLTTTVNATLELKSVSATVTVEASTGQELQTQSGELSGNITKTEITSLPIANLNPISLVLTQPGVQTVASRDRFTNGTGFSVNGTRPRANNFLIDGQDNNDNSINGQAFQPTNLEAIREVTVLTNSYSAEFGRGGGSVTNVIYKGGTNQFHGAAWEMNQNSAFGAIPAESKLAGVTRNPVDNENIFGFSFGGPIKKDKLFIFGTSQWDRERANAGAQAASVLLPTANGVATLQSLGANPRVSFLISSLGALRGLTNTQMIPLGNDPSGNPRPAVEFGFVQRGDTSIVSNSRQWNIKLDYLPTQNDTLSARFVRGDNALSPDFFNFSSLLPPFDTQQGGTSQNFGFTWVRTVSSRAVNELRFSYGQINFTFGPTAATGANPLAAGPAFVISDIRNNNGRTTSFGLITGIPQGRGHNTYQFQDAFSYTVGRHTFKFGADVALLSVVDSIPIDSRGLITINPGGGFTGLANFIDNFTGAGGSVDLVFGNPVTRPFVPNYAPYFQDTWRIRSNFTVDFGLRYEYWGTPENLLQFPAVDTSKGIGLSGTSNFPGVFAAPQIGQKHNFAPRVGFAYTPHFWSRYLGQDKTVIRAGYGIFYDGIFTNILDNTASGSPNAIDAFASSSVGRGLANATGILAGFSPVASAFNGVTTIASNLMNPLTQQWNFNIQREVPGGFIVTAAYVGTRGEHLFVNQEFNPRINGGARVNPNLGPITVRTNGGDSYYHAAQLSVDRKFSRGFLVRGAYTFSRFVDDGSEVFTSSGLSSFAQDPFNQAGDRGLSAFHRAHRYVMSYVWDLPYVHSSDNAGLAILKAITRDWQTAGVLTFQTGAPETVSTGFDTLGDGRGGNDRPNLADPSKGVFDKARYAPPASGLGNVGRNTVVTSGRQDWNLTVQRAFKLPMWSLEAQQLAFRAEFFNAFNHPNLGIPVLNFSSGNFGNLNQTRVGGRQIRLGLKYSF